MNRLILFPAMIALAACAGDDTVPPTAPGPDCATVVDPIEPLRWKRVDAFIGDLSAALELDGVTMCQELGSQSCAELYRIPLGGSDPFGVGIYEAPKAPMNTTPLLVERLALAACTKRTDADATGDPAVFRHVDLSADALSPSDPGVAAQIDELYQRLVARDPSDDERAILASLTDGTSGRDFAILGCFTIATSTEMLLF